MSRIFARDKHKKKLAPLCQSVRRNQLKQQSRRLARAGGGCCDLREGGKKKSNNYRCAAAKISVKAITVSAVGLRLGYGRERVGLPATCQGSDLLLS
jgi:hypothetical protein